MTQQTAIEPTAFQHIDLSSQLFDGVEQCRRSFHKRGGQYIRTGTSGDRLAATGSAGADSSRAVTERDPVVGKVELISSTYLSTSGSFDDLDRIGIVYGLDSIFLFSFEQTQYPDRGLLPRGYWTVIGSYFIHGEKNDTNSMISGVTYNIRQRQMLFRTYGVSRSRELSTPINQS